MTQISTLNEPQLKREMIKCVWNIPIVQKVSQSVCQVHTQKKFCWMMRKIILSLSVWNSYFSQIRDMKFDKFAFNFSDRKYILVFVSRPLQNISMRIRSRLQRCRRWYNVDEHENEMCLQRKWKKGCNLIY